MELDDLRAFARIADFSSVSAAARALSLPKSSVSRSLARLERDVGAALVDRSTRHLRLTDVGIALRPHALRICADVDEAALALDGLAGLARGTLRVSLPFTVAVAVVSPMLPAFLAEHPEVRVVLDVENRVVAMPVEAVDLVIRVGALPDSDLVARRLLTSETWTCASPAYLAGRGTPGTVADLGGHTLVGYSDRATAWGPGPSTDGAASTAFLPAAVVSDSAALLPMVVGGAGIARLPDFLAVAPVGDGRLVRLWPDHRGELIDIHALYPSHRSLSAKVRVFIDALVSQFADLALR